jgi:hypothetical protein
VPEGTAAIEGELQTVGFADPTVQKSDLYWRKDDLARSVRKKTGLK